MKKVVIFLIIILGVFAGYSFLQKSPASTQEATRPPEVTQSGRNGTSVFGSPVKLRISKLGVDATIEQVGMDEKGNMDVPKDPDNAAWYSLGHKVGDNGSAVIAAHFDKPSGEPAVFYKLSSLRPGDTIEVEDDTGKTLTFEVEDSERYPFNDFPLQRVFNTAGVSRLNLITCDGVWNRVDETYSDRLVVYTRLVE